MGLDLGRPGSLLGRITTFGTPWHGLVSGGLLELPNDESMPYPQPGGVQHWETSAAHLVQIPNLPPVQRTESQQTADESAGRQWWDKALLSGGASQLYGVELGAGSWIRVGVPGAHWLVDASALHGKTWTPAGVPASVDITLRPFGVFGAASGAPEVISVTVPDLGQNLEALSSPGTPAGAFDISLFSVHPQGNAAVFVLHYAVPRAWPARRWPCGWLELELVGDDDQTTAQLSVLHDRSATLGGPLQTPGDLEPGHGRYCQAVEEPSYLEFWTKLSSEGTGSHQTCEGHSDQVVTGVLTTDGSPGEGFVQQIEWGIELLQPRHCRQAFVGMVLAIWYSAEGDRRELTLDGEWDWRHEVTAQQWDESGEWRRRTIYTGTPGNCSWSSETISTFMLAFVESTESLEQLRYTLRLDGVAIDQIELAEQGHAEFEYEVGITGDVSGAVSWSVAASATLRAFGFLWDDVPANESTRTESWSSETDLLTDWRRLSSGTGASLIPDWALERRGMEMAIFQSFLPSASDMSYGVRPVWLGQGVFGWLVNTHPMSSSELWIDWSMPSHVVTADGVVAINAEAWRQTYLSSASKFAGLYHGPTDLTWAAFSPVTRNVAISRDGPLCFV